MLEGLSQTFAQIGEDVKEFITEKPITTAGIAVGTLGAAAVGGVLISKAGSKSKTRKKTKKGRSRDRRFKSKQKHEQRYKRKKKYKVYKRKGWIHSKKNNGPARLVKGSASAKA